MILFYQFLQVYFMVLETRMVEFVLVIIHLESKPQNT